MNKPETFSFTTKENINLNMDLYKAEKNRKNITVLYFHGGGLLYGTRDDLPEVYIHMYLEAGYDLLALDYPFAPEANLKLILDSSFAALAYYLENKTIRLGLTNQHYILFGRSAGAYLCFMLYTLLLQNKAVLPLAIISLYGYTRLDEIEFSTPSKHYNKLGTISDAAIEKIIADSPITYGPMHLRFSLYIKARQDGTWINLLCGKESSAAYSLDEEQLKLLPPTLLAAATLDPDVPFRISKALSKRIPNAHLITVYKDVHDFDRNLEDPEGKSTYAKIIQWLENFQA
ncbi:alpha/beta hydrolase [Anaerosinus massiliensis]|uniref:alpha/beta hydrolase n=1 Tax=Massilibacillus massiliensis TaxID=1806837 RepID=UPI000A78C279|nr:alpha/beta hydrolase [Massilibacillus massiliensis]